MLDKIRKIVSNSNRLKEMENDFESILASRYMVSPYMEALKITIIYGIVGALWVLLSDEILSRIINDVETYKLLQTYKGWFYVIATMAIIYILIRNRLILFNKAQKKIYEAYEELNAVHEEQVALEEELRMQLDELESNAKALSLSEQKLEFLAYYDTLTQLPNRTMFEMNINKLIKEKRDSDFKFALVYMDIDNFKQINDTLGHVSGDLLLKYISNILRDQVKLPDFVARLSGDEFVIVFESIRDKDDVANRIDRLLKFLRRPWRIDGQEFFISYSMGITIFPDQGKDLTTLLKNADTAMFHIKESEKDNYCFYNDEMREKTLAYTQMVNELRRAIDNNEFTLYYQPLVSLRDGKISGVEALIRWKHPERGFISPMEFIPLAEETGYIYEIGRWVIKTACDQKRLWEDTGYPPIKISVNISGKSLTGDNLVSEIIEMLELAKTSCLGIQIEVTETAVMKDLDKAIRTLKQLREMGMKIALDDFGSGYSSLTYLRELPIDIVKMDREFIKGSSTEDKVIVKSVIKLMHALDVDVVAEGIETKEQLSFLMKNGCDLGQGYLFSKPVPQCEIEEIFNSAIVYEL